MATASLTLIGAFDQRDTASPLITERVDERTLTVLMGNRHPLARPEFDRGAAPPRMRMERMVLVLNRSPGQEAALERLLKEQLVESSPVFHKWLTPEQFGDQFGPARQDVQTVTAWLRSHGFEVARVSRGRTVVEFAGTAGQIQEAFHIPIHQYLVNGEEHWANADDPQIPTALTPVVVGVVSLHDFPRTPMIRTVGVVSSSRRTGSVMGIRPAYSLPVACGSPLLPGERLCYGLGPYDFATIYNVLPLWNAAIDGLGQHVAILAESRIDVQDARNFRRLFGLPANDPNVVINGPDPGIVKGPIETEAITDVEWVGAVAPRATIDLVVSARTRTTPGFDLSAEYVVDHNIAPIVSGSYGVCELFLGRAGNEFYRQLWQQAAAQGITVLIGSGDGGSSYCDREASQPAPARDGLGVSGTASTPYNVAIGGTDFNDFIDAAVYWNSSNDSVTRASAKGYIPETAWNDSCTNAVFTTVAGFGSNREANCNNPKLADRVRVDGGSGGKSNCTTSYRYHVSSCAGGYPKPAWQAGPGVPADGKRDVPDVSVFAGSAVSGNVYAICEADTGSTCDPNPESRVEGASGTSISVQAFAGLMALVVQYTSSRQGNVNPVLYHLAAQQDAAACNASGSVSRSCVFHDVTVGTIAMPCARNSPDCVTINPRNQYGVLAGYDAGVGYDLAAGLGSVNAFNLVTANDWQRIQNARAYFNLVAARWQFPAAR